MAEIALEKLTKVYADGTQAVHDLDLEVADGELVVFVGPSGCGKTTALRMVAGLEDITAGRRAAASVVNNLPPKDRDMAMIFQNYALYPHMTSFDNMAFGLKMRGIDRRRDPAASRDAAQILGLAEVLEEAAAHLSGGQRQRVAMGRAIVREPQAFLMDEPLSNLDAKLRVEMRAEIARIQRDLNATTIYVTHDQIEAMTLGDRVGVMRGGLLQQVDRPARALRAARQPLRRRVHRLAGDEPRRRGDRQGERRAARGFGENSLQVPDRPELAATWAGASCSASGPRTSRTRRGQRGRHDVAVDIREDLGSEVFLHFGVGAPAVTSGEVVEPSARRRSRRPTSSPPPRQPVHRARSPAGRRRVRASGGADAESRLLHFFELETGEAI